MKLLMDGVVKVTDFDIDYLDYHGPGGMTEFFRQMVTDVPYDIGEQAFAHYLIALGQGKPVRAIPVFPSRFFPHFAVSVAINAGIESPLDLVGKSVGVPDWGFNPGVWMRGILAHQYDVPVERIRWVENNREPLFRGLSYPRSARFEIERVAVEDEAVAHGFLPLIETGRVQGVFLAATGTEAAGLLRKLFPDPYREIRDYVSATGVFPLNTVVTIRSDVIDQNPGLPGRLMEACQRAEQIYLGEIENRSEDYHMGLSLAALREMGLFPISHGLQENQAAIRMMVQYCYEQGLIPKIYEPVEVFADVP